MVCLHAFVLVRIYGSVRLGIVGYMCAFLHYKGNNRGFEKPRLESGNTCLARRSHAQRTLIAPTAPGHRIQLAWMLSCGEAYGVAPVVSQANNTCFSRVPWLKGARIHYPHTRRNHVLLRTRISRI